MHKRIREYGRGIVRELQVRDILRQAILAARRLEMSITPFTPSNDSESVAFGILIRVRRTAEAIGELNARYDYEGRVLVRSILEMYFNYAWIRIGDSPHRAKKFLAFQTLEKLALLRSYPEELRTSHFSEKLAQLERDKAKLKDLFAEVDRRGKVTWAKSWASVRSMEARIEEVYREAANAQPSNRFMYLLYRWFSGVTHGSPQSVGEILKLTDDGVIEKDPNQLSGVRSVTAAALCLLLVLRMAGDDLGADDGFRDKVAHQYENLTRYVHELQWG